MTPPPWRAGLEVAVQVPASSANLGPGFDSVGVALAIFDSCRVTVLDPPFAGRPGLQVAVRGEGEGEVPLDEHHLVVRAMHRAFDVLGVTPPSTLRVECLNAVPHGRGLGSSATAIVTGISAAYALTALAREGAASLDLVAVNDLAAHLEGHPDNSSASVYGGATLSWPSDQPSAGPVPHTTTIQLSPHPDITPVVLVPRVQLSTATARAVLPAHVRLADAAANAARVGGLIHALTNEPGLLLPATRDYLHQEPRRPSYAESMALVDGLRAAGIAAAISGAGPSVLVLAVGEQIGALERFAPPGWSLLSPGFAVTGARVIG